MDSVVSGTGVAALIEDGDGFAVLPAMTNSQTFFGGFFKVRGEIVSVGGRGVSFAE